MRKGTDASSPGEALISTGLRVVLWQEQVQYGAIANAGHGKHGIMRPCAWVPGSAWLGKHGESPNAASTGVLEVTAAKLYF